MEYILDVLHLREVGFGFGVAFTLSNLIACAIGVTLGTFIGALPGIGALAGIAILLPLTFHQGPTEALIMLAGIFYGSNYGGSIASILLNLPGTAASAVSCLDGYPMAQQGRGGIALFMTTIASFIGASFSIILMMAFAAPLAQVALSFQSPEYFGLMVLGMVASTALNSGSPTKGFMMIVLGLVLGLVGLDVPTARERYMFGWPELADGVSLVVVAMGLFGVSEIVHNLISRDDKYTIRNVDVSMKALWPTRDDWSRLWMPSLRGAVVGAIAGVLPGAGGTVATFISYAIEKKISKTPERFGKGAVEGLISAESANNSAAQAEFIPTMSLGIPGNAIMAILLGALIIQNIQPGPQLVTREPELFWGLIASFWIGNVMLMVLNIPMIGIWVKMLSIPYHIMFPAILFFICLGAFAFRNSPFDVYMVAFMGVAGYGLKRLDYPVAPLILSFVLGPLLEENFRRSLVISRGSLDVFLTRPIAATCLAISLAMILYAGWSAIRNGRNQRGRLVVEDGAAD